MSPDSPAPPATGSPDAIGIYILRSYGIGMEDLYKAGVSEFRRHDGRFRARWKTDDDLLEKAGVSGWISGMMRSEVYERMLSVVPSDVIVDSAQLQKYTETSDGVTLHFADGTTYENQSVKVVIVYTEADAAKVLRVFKQIDTEMRLAPGTTAKRVVVVVDARSGLLHDLVTVWPDAPPSLLVAATAESLGWDRRDPRSAAP